MVVICPERANFHRNSTSRAFPRGCSPDCSDTARARRRLTCTPYIGYWLSTVPCITSTPSVIQSVGCIFFTVAHIIWRTLASPLGGCPSGHKIGNRLPAGGGPKNLVADTSVTLATSMGVCERIPDCPVPALFIVVCVPTVECNIAKWFFQLTSLFTSVCEPKSC